MKKTPAAAPVVVVRKKRPVVPSASVASPPLPSRPPIPTPASPVSASAPAAVAHTVPSPPPVARTPSQRGQASPYTRQQRQNYKRHQKIVQSPEFAQISALMVERWPALFRVTPETIRPLAVGIGAQLCAQLSEFSPRDVQNALLIWMRTHRGFYLKALLRGGPRYDLTGNPTGEVLPDHQQHAEDERRRWIAAQKERLRQRKALTAATRKTEERPPTTQGDIDGPRTESAV